MPRPHGEEDKPWDQRRYTAEAVTRDFTRRARVDELGLLHAGIPVHSAGAGRWRKVRERVLLWCVERRRG